jgi:hypothetical protein
MSEPTSAGTAASAVLLGGSTVLYTSVLGLDPTTVLWAAVGGYWGSLLAPRSGVARATISFLLSSLISALGATGFQKYFTISEPVYVWLVAVLIGVGFYPLRDRFISRIPEVYDALLARFGVPPPPKKEDRHDS